MTHLYKIYHKQHVRFANRELVELIGEIVMWLHEHPLCTVLTVSEYQEVELMFHVELEYIDIGERE